MEVALRHLSALDPDLAYLAALTAAGVKPLSRHEGLLPEQAMEWLRALGLETGINQRRAGSGRVVEETVFARGGHLLRIYQSAFSGAPLHAGAPLGRIEGWLFGFPPCCVAAYIERPYAPNGLPESDQSILFHWACPGCAITPLLVPTYREVLGRVRAACDNSPDDAAPGILL